MPNAAVAPWSGGNFASTGPIWASKRARIGQLAPVRLAQRLERAAVAHRLVGLGLPVRRRRRRAGAGGGRCRPAASAMPAISSAWPSAPGWSTPRDGTTAGSATRSAVDDQRQRRVRRSRAACRRAAGTARPPESRPATYSRTFPRAVEFLRLPRLQAEACAICSGNAVGSAARLNASRTASTTSASGARSGEVGDDDFRLPGADRPATSWRTSCRRGWRRAVPRGGKFGPVGVGQVLRQRERETVAGRPAGPPLGGGPAVGIGRVPRYRPLAGSAAVTRTAAVR